MIKRINPHSLQNLRWLRRRKELLAAEKVIYRSLIDLSPNGYCVAPIPVIATESGFKEDHTSNCLHSMASRKLLEIVRTTGKPNVYYFIEHEWMNVDQPPYYSRVVPPDQGRVHPPTRVGYSKIEQFRKNGFRRSCCAFLRLPCGGGVGGRCNK